MLSEIGESSNGLYLDAELAARIPALPTFLSPDVVGILNAAPVWTLDSARPAHRSDRVYADLFVAKVLNRLE